MAPTAPKFTEGEKVLCFHGPLLYEAKCVKTRKDGGNLQYIGLGATHMLTGYDHLIFLFGVVFFLTTFKDVFKSFGAELPVPTQMVIAVSDTVVIVQPAVVAAEKIDGMEPLSNVYVVPAAMSGPTTG